jgi:hypothetical protein
MHHKTEFLIQEGRQDRRLDEPSQNSAVDRAYAKPMSGEQCTVIP